MKHTIIKWGGALLDMLYPPICPCCNLPLDYSARIYCPECQYHLKETDFHLHQDNLFTQHFWGRVDLKTGASMLLYQKGGRVQNLIKKIKYGNRKDLAMTMGLLYGKKLLMSPFYQDLDLIIPVPLHPKRLKERGYNQSFWFAKGLSKSMNIDISTKTLIRLKSTRSQTIKNRLQRNQNLQDAFKVDNNVLIKRKRILLVDDVLTTGATLESCANQLIKNNISDLTMATIAIGLS